MKLSQALSIVGLAAPVIAASVPKTKTCKSFKIPVSVNSTELVYALPHFQSDFDVADFLATVAGRSAPDLSTSFSGTKNVSATYEIGATFCTPTQGQEDRHKDTVLVATHGLGFDRSYWHPNIDEDRYSFVDFVISQGYSIFYYDRLGMSESTKVSGYKAQLSTQVAVLHELIAQIKSGKWISPLSQAKKVVLVGHSYGSSISLAALSADETLADGLVLTGFSLNAKYVNSIGFLLALQPRIASQQQPNKWQQLDSGYLTTDDVYSNVNGFFKAPSFDPKVVKYSENNKQPFATAELLTVAAFDKFPTSFKGPAMIMSGQRDFLFCSANCDGILNAPAAEVFSQSKDFRSVSFPGVGHGLNLHLNATGAYRQITNFLSANGI